jgi:hypothetical protein
MLSRGVGRILEGAEIVFTKAGDRFLVITLSATIL